MEREYVISAEESSQPGRYSFAAYPFLREPFDSFSDVTIDMVAIPKGAQVGWTAGFTGLVGSFAATDPSRILVVMANAEEGEIWSKDRFLPNVQATPALRAIFPKPKTRDGDNKILFKRYPGGALKIVGANSPSGLSSWPPKRAFADEVDRYPLNVGQGGGEGDPIALLRKRIQTWLRRGGKIGLGSSPKIEQTSIIWHYFLMGDRRRWYCPCPHPECRHEQELRWEQLKWDRAADGSHLPATAAYVCEACGACWSDTDRKLAIRGGRWLATAEPKDPRVRSFHIHGLLSPHITHVELATKWLACQTNEQRQAFINLELGIPWRERGETPEWQRLFDRREDWRLDRLPKGVLFLSAGADIQKDRVEIRIWGWGRGRESWLVETIILEGDTARQEVWDRLSEVCGRTWQHVSGATLSLARLAVDSGFATQQVYAWARTRSRGQVLVVKGDGRGAAILGVPKAGEVTRRGKAAKAGVRVWPVNTGPLKRQFYDWLRLERPTDRADGETFGPGYVHFHVQASDAEIKQHTAEQLVTVRTRGGFATQEWQLLPGRRNEGLDTRCYAHAAAIHFGIERFTDRHWAELEASLGIAPDGRMPDDTVAAPAAPPPPSPPPPARRPAEPPRVERVARGRRIHHPTF